MTAVVCETSLALLKIAWGLCMVQVRFDCFFTTCSALRKSIFLDNAIDGGYREVDGRRIDISDDNPAESIFNR